MKIKDDKQGIDIEVKTSLGSTKYEPTFYELASIIGQFMAKHDMSDEQFINQFFANI